MVMQLVAAFVLYNQLMKSGLPTYPVREGLGMVLWHLDLVDQSEAIDVVRHGRVFQVNRGGLTGTLLNGLIRLLPTEIRLQDRVGDELGGLWAGTSPTAGWMQVRADAPPHFANERSVKQFRLLDRLEPAASYWSNRELNRRLLTDPRPR